MDFAQPLIESESVTTKSKIRYIPVNANNSDDPPKLDDMLTQAANQAASDVFGSTQVDSSQYPERVIPQSEKIEENALVVIFESFDNLNFCYAESGKIFNNRNGHFHHGMLASKKAKRLLVQVFRIYIAHFPFYCNSSLLQMISLANHMAARFDHGTIKGTDLSICSSRLPNCGLVR